MAINYLKEKNNTSAKKYFSSSIYTLEAINQGSPGSNSSSNSINFSNLPVLFKTLQTDCKNMLNLLN